ncbi:uncharacterized protein B0H18DRAFT_420760 [Fomitopsis serialis]|uniref:uncharacterized protein n=1 Tax=Fomitopsis serialis TaxID=139415 RepID=UPI002007F8CC|nr:uncharacterized protein B0H18DRAFT_420760 [Neoantrodia serialis]KAH9935697.1 hypothetical protein B0H18DRAFT_420760 [Neoantrodia serialis]
MQRPLVLWSTTSTDFPIQPRRDGYTYVVLGFYRIAHAWAEEQPAQNAHGSVVRYKFAFQWCEEQGAPWWTQSSIPPDVHSESKVFGKDEEAVITIAPQPTLDTCAAADVCSLKNTRGPLRVRQPAERCPTWLLRACGRRPAPSYLFNV